MLDEKIGTLMEQIPTLADTPKNSPLQADKVAQPKKSYYILMSLVRGQALNILVNAGGGVGLAGWHHLVSHYEPRAKTGQ
eukprot:6370560-Prorocentrum_lima.AAC.1